MLRFCCGQKYLRHLKILITLTFYNFFNCGEFHTSAIVPSYAYTYIKLDFLKLLIIDDVSLQKLAKINDINEFIEFIRPFYPNLSIKEKSIEHIELALLDNYIKLVGKIMLYSPENMRLFLKNYLVKFEIMNIKQIIMSSILGMSIEEKKKNVNFLVEKYLDNEEFINNLLKLSTLDEIQLFMRKTKYNVSIREGIVYFKKTKEVFVLESFLDQLYYKNLKAQVKNLNKKEKEMISLFLNYITEIYNINILYRGIKNNIDKKLLFQFLINNYLFLDENKIDYLLNLDNVDIFSSIIEGYIKDIKEISPFYKTLGVNKKHLIRSIEVLYLNYYFKKFKLKIDDIDLFTIFKILELIIKKEKEIRFYIMPKIVKLLQEKFSILKHRKDLKK